MLVRGRVSDGIPINVFLSSILQLNTLTDYAVLSMHDARKIYTEPYTEEREHGIGKFYYRENMHKTSQDDVPVCLGVCLLVCKSVCLYLNVSLNVRLFDSVKSCMHEKHECMYPLIHVCTHECMYICCVLCVHDSSSCRLTFPFFVSNSLHDFLVLPSYSIIMNNYM